MTRQPCRVCGCSPDTDIAPGRLRDLRLLLGPKMRTTIGGHREVLCWWCQFKAARLMGVWL